MEKYTEDAKERVDSEKGDLISRKALKKALRECAYCYDCVNICIWIMKDEVSDIIDNAPTVFTYTEDDMCVATGNGYDIAKKLYEFDAEDFKRFVESRVDMQDLYLPIHFFDLLDEYRGLDRRKATSDREIARVLNAINNEPTVVKENLTTERKGEWIYGEDKCGQDGWFCSKCGFFVPWYYQYYEEDADFIREYKVCPHCEAKMITYTGEDRDMRGDKE